METIKSLSVCVIYTCLTSTTTYGSTAENLSTQHVTHLTPFGQYCELYSPNEWDKPFVGESKGIRVAPLCIPDPCDGVIDRDDLSMWYVGRPVTDDEWGEYSSNYAEVCCSETVPFNLNETEGEEHEEIHNIFEETLGARTYGIQFAYSDVVFRRVDAFNIRNSNTYSPVVISRPNDHSCALTNTCI